MIKATIDKEKIIFAAQGSTIDITTDVCKLISAIYQRLDDDDGKNAMREAFRKSLVHVLTDSDSPLFMPIDEELEA